MILGSTIVRSCNRLVRSTRQNLGMLDERCSVTHGARQAYLGRGLINASHKLETIGKIYQTNDMDSVKCKYSLPNIVDDCTKISISALNKE